MQRPVGQCHAWFVLHSGVLHTGSLRDRRSDVCPADLGMYQESVQFNITTVPGIKNAFFGGDGKIGRASCRERGEMSECGAMLKKRKERDVDEHHREGWTDEGRCSTHER